MMLMRSTTQVFFFLFFFISLSSCYSTAHDNLRKADEMLREGNFAGAVAAYQRHMTKRLLVVDRPEWENPYFYELLIGDVYLTQGNVTEALVHYEIAEKQGVHVSLVADRYRTVASWFEERGELKKAFDLLVKYRDRDSLLFDSMLDRVGRMLTDQEESAPGTPSSSPSPPLSVTPVPRG